MKKLLPLFALVASLFCLHPLSAQPCSPPGSPPLALSVVSTTNACNNGPCNGTAQVAATGGTAPYNYTWDFNALLNSSLATGLCAGSYTVTVTDINACTAFTNITIGVYPIVNITVTGSASINYTYTANVSGAPGPFNYSWSSGESGPTLITATNTNTYCVTVSTSPGCYTVACSGIWTIQPSTCQLCNGSVTLPNMGTYVISNSNGFSQNFIGPGVMNGLCAGAYTAFYPTTNTLTNFTINNVGLPLNADAGFTTSIGNAPVLYACTGQSIQFTAPNDNLFVFWNFGVPTSPNNTSNQSNPTFVYQNAGTYTVTLIAQGCNNTDTLQRTIIIEQGIAPPIECASLVCPGSVQTYTTSVECDTYNWVVTSGSITSGQNSAQITVVWNNVPMGTVELTVGNCDGSNICNPVGSIQVPIVSNNIPISGPNLVCQGATAVYSVPQYGGATYTWSVNSSSSNNILWQDQNQVGIKWNYNGTVSVNVSSSLAGCSVSISESVQVKSPYSISGPDLVCPGSQVTYTASGGMHNWSVTGNAGIAGGGTNSGNVSILAGTGLGGYTVTATPVNPTLYCNAPQSISATLAEQPAPPQLIDLGYICPGNVYTHQIASPAAGVSYAWNVVGGTPATGSGTSLSILWNVGSPAYSVSITAQNNTAPFCTASSNTAILPLTQIAIVGDEDICAGERAYYTAAPYMPDLTYTWTITPSLAGSVISGQGTYGAEVQWNNNYPSATLTVSACNLSITIPITIHQPPTPTIVPSGYLCEGSNITLSVSPPGFSQYEWQNGSTNNAMSIVNGGNYLVTVTDVYGCVGNTVINIHQYPQPAAHLYSSTGNLVCIENPVDKIIGVSSGIGYTYEWFLNGSPFAGNVNPITHTATAAPGSFNYRAVVTSEYGCQKTSPILTIVQDSCIGGGGGGLCNLLPGNYLGFTSNATYCNTLNFQNTSSGATNYVWNFGDGSPLVSAPTTNAQTHTYAEPGYYLVALQGTFPSANPPPSVCTRTEYQYVHVPLKADFEFMFACVNLATQFINKTTYTYNTNITSWSWDFGDGSTATDVNPAHVFPAPGNYTVTLTVTTATCIDVVTKTVAIVQLPDVSFAITNPVCEGTASTFTPAPNPDAINWLWDFGNGASVFAQQPEQSYLQNGDYTVQLTVTNNTGCTNTGSQTISVLPVGSGNIVPSSLSACIGQSITLTPPAGSSYLWTNGSTDNPLLAAQSGSYAVTVTQANSCTFKTPPHTLNFTPIPPANITPPATPLNLCPGTNLQLSANAGTNYAYAWSTGQSTSAISIPFSNVPASGLSVTVTVTDAQSGCMNTSTTIQVNPVSLSPPSISPSTAATLHLCQGETAILTATHPTLSNFSWSTGATGNAITVSATGNYTVVVADANGCTSSANKVVLVNDGGNMDAIPVGCYDYCELQPISIPNVYAGYQWLLNGIPIPGATGNQFVPPQTGDYQLQITTPLGCQDTSDVLSLNLIDCLACMATASFTHTLNCSDIQFYATGSGGNGVLSYNWDFGDGNTDTVPNPSHTFAASGTYTICLTVSNLALDGEICTDTLCFNITNYGDDNLNIVTDNLTDAHCGEADGSISLTIAGSNPPYIIQWSDLNTNEDRINLPAGTYTLTVTDTGGCTATQSFTLVELPLAASPLVCSTTTQTELTVSWTDIPAAVGYELVLSGNSPINLPPGTTQYTFTGLQPNTGYTITLEVIAPAACTGSPPTQVTCTTQPDPCATNAPTATAQATNALCGTDTGGINITISGGTPPFAFEWSNLSNDQNLTDLIGGTYTLTITDALACTGTASAVVGEYMPLPELSCLSTSDTEILLTWEPVNGASGYELLINFGSPNNFPPDYTQFTYPNLMPDTQYSFSLSVEQSGNCAASDFVVVTCTTASPACQADNAEALIDADITMVQPAEPVTLSVSTGGLSGALTYLWAADGLALLCTDSICAFLPDMTTTYSVTVTDIYGCTASAEITIDVRMPNKVIAPNAFTPNGDAINSTFRLVGYNVANLQFSVWDNWGRKVYDSGTTTDLSLGWDGKYKGKDCSIGVYVFKALVRYTDNSEEWLQGNITLIR